MSYRAVLFDLDGTLLNSIDGIIDCFGQVLQEFVPDHTYTREQMILKIGEPVSRQMYDFSGGAQHLVDAMVAKYRSLMSHILASFPLYPGARETLFDLKKQGFLTGLVTSKSKDPCEISFTRHQMHSWFDVIVTADDTKIHKPFAEPLLFAAEKMSLLPTQILFVGDSVHDINCAHAAGAAAGAAYWGPFPRATLDTLNPAFGFESLPEIPKTLRQRPQ